MEKVIALFDFDGTLIKGDSLSRFLLYYLTPWTFIKKLPFMVLVLLRYIIGLIDKNIAKEQIFSLFFTGAKREEFTEKARLFSLSVIPTLVKGGTIQRLKWHQTQNHQCILVSASIEEYLLPWAESIGFSKVLATRMEVDEKGNLTGKFYGKNCKGTEKVRRIEEYMGRLTLYKIYAYGDSRGDKELLEIADHPFYKSFKEERFYS